MRKAHSWALLGLQLFSHLPSSVRADETDGITASCNDDNTITVGINYMSSAAQILSATYGTCSLGDNGISGTDGTSNTGWNITLAPSRCNMESNLRTLVYNQTAQFVVGKKDGATELVTATFEIDTYCSYTSEYTVTYGYDVDDNSYQFTDSGGLLGIEFVIESFKSDFSGTQTPSQQAGHMIYLGLYINETATSDFDHADGFSATTGKMFVPTQCALNDGSYTYTLFDTVNDTKCTNDFINLGVSYNSSTHMWEINHLIFLLNSGGGIPTGPVTYSLSCKITVCDAAKKSSCLAAASCLGVVCVSPLKADSEGKCVPDWQKVSSAVPSDWADKVKTASSQDYDVMFKANNGNFLSILAEGGTLEELEHAVNLIEHVGLKVSDYLEIQTTVSGRSSKITPFLRACLDLSAEGPKKLALLAALGANTKQKAGNNGLNVLNYAAVFGSAETLQFVIDQEFVSYADSRTRTGSDPLICASWDKYTPDQLEKLKILKVFNPTAAVTRSDGQNVFMGIAKFGSPRTLRYVLDTFPFVDTRDSSYYRSAPFFVPENGDPSIQVELLTMLFDAGFSKNTRARYNSNLLHWFCQYSASPDAIELLGGMAARAEVDFSINSRNSNNRTPLYMLSRNTVISNSDDTRAYNFLVGKGATRSLTAPDSSEDMAALPTITTGSL